MINNQTFEQYPEFGNNATKASPDEAKYAQGFQESDVLPAEWMNWAWSHNTKGITALNSGVSSIEKELNNIVTAGGQTPDVTKYNQVLEAIQYLMGETSAPIDHAASTTTYGAASTDNFGHVKVTADNGLSIAEGVLALAKATVSAFGSAKVINDLTTSSHSDGVALSAYQGYLLGAYNLGMGTCETSTAEASSQPTLEVNLTNYPGVTLGVGSKFRVVFTYDYKYDGQPKMNVNNSSPMPVTVGNVAAGIGAFQAGKSYEFVFTGTSFDCLSSSIIEKREGAFSQPLNPASGIPDYYFSYVKYSDGYVDIVIKNLRTRAVLTNNMGSSDLFTFPFNLTLSNTNYVLSQQGYPFVELSTAGLIPWIKNLSKTGFLCCSANTTYPSFINATIRGMWA